MCDLHTFTGVSGTLTGHADKADQIGETLEGTHTHTHTHTHTLFWIPFKQAGSVEEEEQMCAVLGPLDYSVSSIYKGDRDTAHTNTKIHTHTHTPTDTPTHTHTHSQTHAHTHTHTHTHTHLQIQKQT